MRAICSADELDTTDAAFRQLHPNVSLSMQYAGQHYNKTLKRKCNHKADIDDYT